MKTDPIDQLSPREHEVLSLAGDGLQTKEIARQLGLSPRTVDDYIARAVAKLGARNRLMAARMLLDTTPVLLRAEPAALAVLAVSPDPVTADRSMAARMWRQLPILRNGRLNNDLTTIQRLGWILVGAIAIIVILAQLSQGLRVAQEIALGLHS